MTDTTRCEPPESLRGVDGWYMLARKDGDPRPWFWVPSDECGQAHWANLGCPAQAYHDGYRYLAPVTPPAVVGALVAALEKIAYAPDHSAAFNIRHIALVALARVRQA